MSFVNSFLGMLYTSSILSMSFQIFSKAILVLEIFRVLLILHDQYLLTFISVLQVLHVIYDFHFLYDLKLHNVIFFPTFEVSCKTLYFIFVL